jgi:polar amino acid transport system substrate-binding protein
LRTYAGDSMLRLFKLLGTALGLCCLGQALAAETLVINSGEFPPYVSDSLPGKGPHPQIVAKVFAQAGIEVKTEIQPWNRAYEEVKLGQKVASLPWLKTAEREKDLYYPKVPIEEIKDVMFYRKDKFPQGVEANSLEELVKIEVKEPGQPPRKLRIVGIGSYWYAPKLKELGANHENVAKPQLAYAMVAAGRADVHINTDKVGQMELQEFYPGKDREQFGMSTAFVHKAPVYLAFSRKHPRHKELADLWDKLAPKVIQENLR